MSKRGGFTGRRQGRARRATMPRPGRVAGNGGTVARSVLADHKEIRRAMVRRDQRRAAGRYPW